MAKQTVEVTYSNSLKINKGNYEQESPFYAGKIIFEVDADSEVENVSNAKYGQIKGIVDPLLYGDYNKKRTDLTNVRIREKDGKKYPSVSSILRPDGLNSKIKNLDKYIERGNQADKIMKNYLTKGKILKPASERFDPLIWDIDIYDYCERNNLVPSKKWEIDKEVFNEEWMYSGEIDLIYDLVSVDDVKYADWRWEQLVAYAKCLDLQKMRVFDLKTNKVYTLGINDPEAIKAWEKFLYARGEFKARFGI